MTTRRLIMIALALGAMASVGLALAWRQAADLRARRDQLEAQQARLTEGRDLARRERDQATRRAARMADEVALAQSNAGELTNLRAGISRMRRQIGEERSTNAELALQTGMAPLLAPEELAKRIDQLKQHLAATPSAAIPEFKFLTDEDWNKAAWYPLEQEEDYRRAMASLRASAQAHFTTQLHEALARYLQDHHTNMPDRLADLRPYFATPPDDEILQRYAVVSSDEAPGMSLGGDKVIVAQPPVDPDYDQIWVTGEAGAASISFKDHQRAVENAPVARVLMPAFMAYLLAHDGIGPRQPEELLPYLTTPEQKAAYPEFLRGFQEAQGKTLRELRLGR
jgi:hypothetical protein